MAKKKNRKSTINVPGLRDKHNAAHGKGGMVNALRKSTTLEQLNKNYEVLKKVTGASTKIKKQWAVTYEICKKALEEKANPLPPAGEAGAGETLAQGAAQPQETQPVLQKAEAEGESDEDLRTDEPVR